MRNKKGDLANSFNGVREKRQAPTLYHIVHGEMVGDTIHPSRANDRDTEDYVYATTNLREALPYLAKNGTRIMNVQVPGSEDFITFIPDRDDFLKNKQFGGTIYQLNGEGFEQHPVRKDNQWVSREGVKVSDANVFDRISSMDDAMRYGLHILFTREPYSAESYDFIAGLVDAPDFPCNLAPLIANGTLVYENAERGCKTLPELSKPISRTSSSAPSPRSV